MHEAQLVLELSNNSSWVNRVRDLGGYDVGVGHAPVYGQ